MVKEIVEHIRTEGPEGKQEALGGLARLGFSGPETALKNLKLLAGTPVGGGLEGVVRAAAASPSPDSSLNNLEAVTRAAGNDILAAAMKDGTDVERLLTITGSSQMLSNTLVNNPGYLEWLFTGGLNETKGLTGHLEGLRSFSSGLEEFDAMARALRVYKHREYLRLGARDLLGLTTVEELTGEISDLASASLEEALGFSIRTLSRAYGAPLEEDGKEAGIAVIALGKFGGHELNFSSDIDILFVYSSDRGGTTGVEGRDESRITLHDFFVRAATMTSRLISGMTDTGFVFRVDLDLRPEGRSGAMANSLAGMEGYYETFGQTWERAAMLKARAVAGDSAVGAAFQELIRPFVFRKYLDFTAIEEIKTMKEKIDLSLLRSRPDAVDVKLGVGGIREIEFFCQALQLIHGGKDPEVREKNTLRAISTLKALNYLKGPYAETLTDGYVFLRNLEHRIQIVEGRQSQAIPARPEELERLARMMGFKDTGGGQASAAGATAGDLFWERYKVVTASVHEVYKSLFYGAEEETPEVPGEVRVLFGTDVEKAEALKRVEALGFKDPEGALKVVQKLKSPQALARLSSRARVLLERLAPVFLHKASGSPDPDRALANLEGFLSAVRARTTYYSLLAENPRVAEMLLKIFGTSEFLSRSMIEHPENLDVLLSKELSVPHKTLKEFTAEFRGVIEAEDDYEERLDALRRVKNQEVIRIGLNDIVRGLTTEEISAEMTALADAALEGAYLVATTELSRTYGAPRGGSFAVLGLGKLGGGELIYGSDLDIIFVYEDKDGAEGTHTTDGAKEISNHEFYVKLCQRIISVLTLMTREGNLFSVDTRLRPSGSAGPLVVSRDALLRYHASKTSVWERQAFTKARSVAGDIELGREVIEELSGIIYSRPLTGQDAGEMLRIRKRMEVEIAKETESRYNVKTGVGGIVDIEFLVQALQLKHGGENPRLRTPVTLAAIDELAGGGFITRPDAETLKKAYEFFRLLETRQRIVHDRPEGYLEPGLAETATLARRAGYTGGAADLIKDYKDLTRRVRAIYTRTLEGLA